MNSFSGNTAGKPQFSWLKVIGALAVLWLTAKVIGAILSPGMLLLGLVVWLVVRSQRNKAQKAAKPVVHFVPTAMTFPFAASQPMPYAQPVQPVPPAGYWMPSPSPSPSPSPVLDERTLAEREIEEYVQRSWPNV